MRSPFGRPVGQGVIVQPPTPVEDTTLPTPDQYVATTGYFYFGYADVDSGWLIRRQNRLSVSGISAGDIFQSATGANNATHADLANAWAVRETLSYV